ncbi:MAG: hypothetical protein II945_07900 [Bacteroidales bacterium]|nr:hypothetical protein [Bacteroidales bacterium]
MKKVLFLVVAVVALLFTSCKKEFVITVQSNNESWGSVIGSGTYAKGTVISIGAIAKSGYRFVSWQDGNTENPRSVTVQSDAIYIATFTSDGEEPTNMGGISVSATQKVYFSPGNLQWSATNGGSTSTTHVVADGTAEGTWRFAPNQWDTIGAGNSNISSTYTGWIDLFGWGTSGYDNKYPYMISEDSENYGNGLNNIAGTNYDWGVYNAIYNPKTNTTDAYGTWRTLTEDEWNYLLYARPTSSNIRFARAIVCGIEGLIIVSDSCPSINYPLYNVNNSFAEYTSNIIGATDWAKMETVGCVFLPAAGYRIGTWLYDVGSCGEYWSTTYNCSDFAYYLYFDSGGLNLSCYHYRDDGRSVRLVRSAE